MIGVGIAIIVAIGVGIFWAIEDDEGLWSVLGGLWVAFLTFLGGLAILTVIYLICISVPALGWNSDRYEKHDIISLKDSKTTEGQFFLGTGYIDGEMKYVWYQKTEYGYKLRTAPKTWVEVREDTDKPYVEVGHGCNASWEWLVPCFQDGGDYIFHIPKGSIKSGFVLDAE